MVDRQFESYGEFVDDQCEQARSLVDENTPVMTALFKLEAGKLTLQRSTWKFPTAEFRTAVQLLAQGLEADMRAVPPPPIEPLPEARVAFDLPSLPEAQVDVEASRDV